MPTTSTAGLVGQRVRGRLKARELTQSDVGSHLGLSPVASAPAFATVAALLDCPITDLMERSPAQDDAGGEPMREATKLALWGIFSVTVVVAGGEDR